MTSANVPAVPFQAQKQAASPDAQGGTDPAGSGGEVGAGLGKGSGGLRTTVDEGGLGEGGVGEGRDGLGVTTGAAVDSHTTLLGQSHEVTFSLNSRPAGHCFQAGEPLHSKKYCRRRKGGMGHQAGGGGQARGPVHIT